MPYSAVFFSKTYLSKLGEKPDFMIDLEGSNFSAVRENQREERERAYIEIKRFNHMPE